MKCLIRKGSALIPLVVDDFLIVTASKANIIGEVPDWISIVLLSTMIANITGHAIFRYIQYLGWIGISL